MSGPARRFPRTKRKPLLLAGLQNIQHVLRLDAGIFVVLVDSFTRVGVIVEYEESDHYNDENDPFGINRTFTGIFKIKVIDPKQKISFFTSDGQLQPIDTFIKVNVSFKCDDYPSCNFYIYINETYVKVSIIYHSSVYIINADEVE